MSWAKPARQGLTVRIRPRNAGAQSAVTRLVAAHFPEQMQPPRKPESGLVLCCSRGELHRRRSHLLASSQRHGPRAGRRAGRDHAFGVRATSLLDHRSGHGVFCGVSEPTSWASSMSRRTLSPGTARCRRLTTDRAVGAAVEQALAFEEMGADILDIGAESTRPGAAPIGADEELRRLVPALAAIRRATSIPLSVDTYKSAVAHAAIAEGADMINDVRGMAGDPAHGRNRRWLSRPGRPDAQSPAGRATTDAGLGGRYVGVQYADLVLDVLEELGDLLDSATGRASTAAESCWIPAWALARRSSRTSGLWLRAMRCWGWASRFSSALRASRLWDTRCGRTAGGAYPWHHGLDRRRHCPWSRAHRARA